MRYVFSDLTFPALEGLHQNTLSMWEILTTSGVELQVCGFARYRHFIDIDTLFASGIGIQRIRRFAGPWLGAFVLFRAQRSVSRRDREVLASDAVLHLEGIVALSQLRPDLQERTVVSLVDSGSLRQARLARQESRRVARFARIVASRIHERVEKWASKRCAIVHVVSEDDRDHLVKHLGLAADRIVAIPLASTAGFTWAAESARRVGDGADPARLRVLVYVDLRQSHLHAATIRFLEELRTSTDGPTPVLEIAILGRIPPSPELRRAGRGQVDRYLSYVDNRAEILDWSDVVVLPDDVGTGIKTRAVEGLMMGRPVIGLSWAYQGISAGGRETGMCDSLKEMAQLLNRYSSDRELLVKAAAAAQMAVRELEEDACALRWLELYRRLLGTKDLQRSEPE